MKKFSVGIDLGTSNSSLSVTELPEGNAWNVPAPQRVDWDKIEALSVLPSAIYIATSEERSAVTQGWDVDPALIAGTFARTRGSEVPDRVLTSAKSWLCFHEQDPRAPILPWGSEIPEGKLSPFEASRLILQHLRQALLRSDEIRSESGDCEVVLTVPASFDETARALTLEAAHAAGFPEVTLLEEPLAAFYNWLEVECDNWRSQLAVGDLVLVCDVGGGTADFSLISIADEGGNLSLRRIAVGDHILLGGDNMDLALALSVKKRMEEAGNRLDHWQFLSLIHLVRAAKERMMEDPSLDEHPLTLPGKGSSLFAKAVSGALLRSEVEEIILGGFVPFCGISEIPHEERRSGLMEFGLAYAQDPALSRHLAQFLVRSAEQNLDLPSRSMLVNESDGKKYCMPTHVLFNGGVFSSRQLRLRVLDVLNKWSQGREVRELPTAGFDLAVSRGAAVFGRMKATGKGLRVKAGLTRSYYIGLERAALSAPGYRPPLRAVAVAPQGTEEGTDVLLQGREFSLVLGQKVRFRFFNAQGRADAVGDIIDDAEETLEKSFDMEASVQGREGEERRFVPVRLRCTLSDIGVMELWMEALDGSERWKLELNTRVEQ